jgi:hypothetical protein
MYAQNLTLLCSFSTGFLSVCFTFVLLGFWNTPLRDFPSHTALVRSIAVQLEVGEIVRVVDRNYIPQIIVEYRREREGIDVFLQLIQLACAIRETETFPHYHYYLHAQIRSNDGRYSNALAYVRQDDVERLDCENPRAQVNREIISRSTGNYSDSVGQS